MVEKSKFNINGDGYEFCFLFLIPTRSFKLEYNVCEANGVLEKFNAISTKDNVQTV